MVTKSKRERKTLIEQTIVVLAVLIAGVTLQLVLGPFDKEIIAYPVNLLFFALPFLALLLKRGRVLRALSSGSLSVILLVLTTIIALWMGLVPGNRAQISWPFVLLYFMLLLNLSAVVAVRLRRFSLKEIPFLLNHLALLVVLLAAGPGAADKSRWMMSVNEGSVEWRATPSLGPRGAEAKELPIAIELIEFEMEEYPPKIGVVNRLSGEALPLGRPQFHTALAGASFTIEQWSFEVDSIVDRERMAPAAYVRVVADSVQQLEGWVSCGNYFQTYQLLNLNDSLAVAMTYPDPKQYRSKINVFLQKGEGGKRKEGVVEVNKPFKMGKWKIYQYSYDTRMGRDSRYSTFELVYDPWERLTFWGLILMLFGAATLFWEGSKARKGGE